MKVVLLFTCVILFCILYVVFCVCVCVCIAFYLCKCKLKYQYQPVFCVLCCVSTTTIVYSVQYLFHFNSNSNR